MMTVVARGANLAPYLQATNQAVASQLRPIALAPISKPKILVDRRPKRESQHQLNQLLPKHPYMSASSGPAVKSQVRFAHTDVRIPDFTSSRRKSVQDPTIRNSDSVEGRNAFTYVILGGASVGGVYGAKTIVYELVGSMAASADVLALAKIEVKLSDIPEGKNVTFKWRGKPLFIRHRTAEEIDIEGKVDISTLRDPQLDSERAEKPEWLVLIGVCTHLGCVPIANAGDFGGYYCPCHGSHYDASGRIRKGPAPLNLEIPPYVYPTETTLLVG